MNKIIKYLLRTSLIKTIYFNIKYFGINGIKMPVFVSRNFKLSKCKGRIFLENKRTATIMLGYHDVVLFDRNKEKGIWHVEGDINFNGTCRLGHGSRIVVSKSGILTFGKENIISANSSICCHKEIKFGDDVIISWDCLFMDTDFHKIIDEKKKVINENRAIIIGSHNWFGCGVTVLKGSIIRNNTIIAANTTISKKINTNNCIIKNNGEIVKCNINWEK